MENKRIAIYCRVSTEEQDGNFSIQEQQSRGLAWAKASGYEYQLFSDTFTGTKLDRPAFSQFLNSIQHFSGIWIIEFTRLTRNVVDAYKLLEILKANNIDTYIDGELRNIEKPEDHLTFGVNAVIADYERLRIKERFARAVKKKKQTGGFWAPVSLYGYEAFYNESGARKIRIVPEEADIVKWMFDQVSDHGKALADLSRELNKRGVPTKQNGRDGWQSAFIGKYLRKTLYAGYYIFEGQEVQANDFPAIVTREQFNRVQTIINGRRQAIKTRYTQHKSTGLVRCYYCDAKVMFNTKNEKRSWGYAPTDYYLIKHNKDCTRNKGQAVSSFTPPEVWDFFVAVNFIQFALDRESLLKYYEREREKYAHEEEQINSDIKRLETEIAGIVQSKKKAIKLYTTLEGDADVFNAVSELSTRQKEREAKLKDLKNSLLMDSERLNVILGKISTDLLREYVDGSPVQKRRLISSLTKDAFIKDNTLRWQWITGRVTGIPDLKVYKKLIISALRKPQNRPGEKIPAEMLTSLFDKQDHKARRDWELTIYGEIITQIFSGGKK